MGKSKLKSSSPYVALILTFILSFVYWARKKLHKFEEQSRQSNLNTKKVIEEMRRERQEHLDRLLSVEHEDDSYKSPN